MKIETTTKFVTPTEENLTEGTVIYCSNGCKIAVVGKKLNGFVQMKYSMDFSYTAEYIADCGYKVKEITNKIIFEVGDVVYYENGFISSPIRPPLKQIFYAETGAHASFLNSFDEDVKRKFKIAYFKPIKIES